MIPGSQESRQPHTSWQLLAVIVLVVFAVLLLLSIRAFLVEPYRIPSGSMMPTLLIGDHILVDKSAYGVRIPFTVKRLLDTGTPEHGDVVVFKYPEDPSIPFIARVVGLPGDKVSYYDKTLHVNGEAATQELVGPYLGSGPGSRMTGSELRKERLIGREHPILIQPRTPTVEGETVVPEGHYFVLGDNRDNSRDSRFWGTVPHENLIGKAFLVWWNGNSLGRAGTEVR